jgi:hypothetical protein
MEFLDLVNGKHIVIESEVSMRPAGPPVDEGQKIQAQAG